MKRSIVLILVLSLLVPAVLAEDSEMHYRFADAGEAAELLLGNREYYENLTQNDIEFRMQESGAALQDLETFAAAQTRDFTDEEKASIDRAMAHIRENCAKLGYVLPSAGDIVFGKTTMAEECGASAYTHGTQIYLGEKLLAYGSSDNPAIRDFFDTVIAHELFHCLTRNHPEFRAAMYAILGFTVADADFVVSPEIREMIIANPDVEHHNAYAAFEINGKMTDCLVVFAATKNFERAGDNFFDCTVTGLVPIDDLSTLYTADDAANFWDVFGRNTGYVIDPEETLADNFSYALIYGMNGSKEYNNPEIIQAIDSLLKSGFEAEDAA